MNELPIADRELAQLVDLLEAESAGGWLSKPLDELRQRAIVLRDEVKAEHGAAERAGPEPDFPEPSPAWDDDIAAGGARPVGG